MTAGWHTHHVRKVEPERVRVLPEPVDVRRSGVHRLHAEVLRRLKNERVRRGREEHLFDRARAQYVG